MSAMRSASSITSDRDLRRGRARCARAGRSSGRASRPRPRCGGAGCGSAFHRRAAVERGDAHADLLAERREHVDDLLGELARRHEHERGRVAGLRPSRRVCSIGRPNASVLPEPVWALPHTSRPASASSMVACLDGEGVVDALGREGVDELGPKAEVRERGHAEVPFDTSVVDWPRTRWLHTTIGIGRNAVREAASRDDSRTRPAPGYTTSGEQRMHRLCHLWLCPGPARLRPGNPGTARRRSALGRIRTCAHGSGGRCSIP